MAHSIPQRNSNRRRAGGIGIALLIFGSMFEAAYADESGVSYWLPGRFGSLAATPQVPGWSMAAVYYHTSVEASGAVAAARQIQIGRFAPTVNVNLNASLNAQADLILLNPTYTFGTPVLGGQLAIGITGLFGRASTSIDGTLTTVIGPIVGTRTGSISDSLTSVGDLYPQATLKWNDGVHNYMTYVTGDIPVGAYDPSRLSNLGIGHAAIEQAAVTLTSTRRPGTNSPPSRVSPTTSRIPTRNTRAESTSTSIGESRNSFPSRFSSASSVMDTSRSPTTSVRIRGSADSGPVSSGSVRSSDCCFRSATCKDIST